MLTPLRLKMSEPVTIIPNKQHNLTPEELTTINLNAHNVYLHVATTFEPPHDETNKMACAPSEGSHQPGHPPSLIRVFFSVLNG